MQKNFSMNDLSNQNYRGSYREDVPDDYRKNRESILSLLEFHEQDENTDRFNSVHIYGQKIGSLNKTEVMPMNNNEDIGTYAYITKYEPPKNKVV